MTRAARAVFGLLAAVHLGALLADGDTLAHLTKPALMPALAVYVLGRRGPGTLVAALLLGCGGDVLLQIGGRPAFLAGMGCFAVGHLCYLALFRRVGPPRTGPWTAIGYGATALGSTALLWPGLPADLRIPVALYSALLAAMAHGALRAGPRAAAGGALFLLSDGLIAAGLAEWPRPPLPQLWIMATYLAAQWLLAGALASRDGDGDGRHPGNRGVPPVLGSRRIGALRRHFSTASSASAMPAP